MRPFIECEVAENEKRMMSNSYERVDYSVTDYTTVTRECLETHAPLIAQTQWKRNLLYEITVSTSFKQLIVHLKFADLIRL